MSTSFHIIVGNPYAFFGEVSIQIFSTLCFIIFLVMHFEILKYILGTSSLSDMSFIAFSPILQFAFLFLKTIFLFNNLLMHNLQEIDRMYLKYTTP